MMLSMPVPQHAGTGVERVLMRGAVEQVWSARMRPGCRCRDARRNPPPPRAGAMRDACMLGGDRDVVEQAESHRAGRLRVVPRRTDGAEGVLGRAGHDQVDGVDRAAGARSAASELSLPSQCRGRAKRNLPSGWPRGSPPHSASGWTRSITARSASGACSRLSPLKAERGGRQRWRASDPAAPDGLGPYREAGSLDG